MLYEVITSLKAEKKCLKNILLPHKKKILKKAERETDLYLKNNYNNTLPKEKE